MSTKAKSMNKPIKNKYSKYPKLDTNALALASPEQAEQIQTDYIKQISAKAKRRVLIPAAAIFVLFLTAICVLSAYMNVNHNSQLNSVNITLERRESDIKERDAKIAKLNDEISDLQNNICDLEDEIAEYEKKSAYSYSIYGGNSTYTANNYTTPSNVYGGIETYRTYILNTNTKKFHLSSCISVNQIKISHRKMFTGARSEVISMGYSPCGNCNP